MPAENYPTDAMAEEAERGLAWRSEYGRGGTLVGVARARDIANKRNLSDSTIRRMNSYFARHEVDKQGEGFSPGEDGYPSAGRIAWALWGGDPGQSWAAAWVRRKESENQTTNKFMNVIIENKAARVRLDEQVDKVSMDRIREEISQVYGAKAAENGMVTGDIVNCASNAADTLDIDIHSPGGSVIDGYTLYNEIIALRGRGVYVTARINLAASMASVIAMAADEIIMMTGSRMMIHEASGMTAGDANEHMRQAKLLESISDEIAAIYADRTGMTKEETRTMMKEETWMSGPEAVKLGFADRVDNGNREDKNEAMSILDRLTNPSSAEAAEKISALENQIASHDSVVAEFTAKLAAAEAALQEASEQLTVYKVKAEAAEQAAAETSEKVEEQAQKIEELTKKVEEVDAQAAAKAVEIVASAGIAAPLPIEGEQTGPVDHIAAMAKMSPADRTKYFRENQKAIRASLK